MTGIYKITSPSGNVYIGQSYDIKARWGNHKRKTYLSIPIAYSIKTHGADSHVFEIIHELPSDVSKEVMDTYEILYIGLYREAGLHLLNSKSGGRTGRLPLDVIEKIRTKNTGQKRTAEQRAMLSKACMGRAYHGKNNGKVRSDAVRKLHSEIQSNRTDNKGEFHHSAILTNEIVLAIRAKYIPKVYGCKKLAAEFGINKDHILDIVNRKIWNHI